MAPALPTALAPLLSAGGKVGARAANHWAVTSALVPGVAIESPECPGSAETAESGEPKPQPPAPLAGPKDRVRTSGKLLRLAGRPWYVKGLTYGPFAPNSDGHFLPERSQLLRDLAHMRSLGANALRLYHLPPSGFLDDALEHGLRVLIDVPWDKHRCFFEDWAARQEAIRRVEETARDLGRHPGVFAVSVANEIPKDIVRFYGASRVEKFIDSLVDACKQQAPGCLATYTNYPSTEFLSPTRLDFYCANVYLDDSVVLGQYLDRLQHVAGAMPLVLGEYGIDSLRNTPQCQADLLAWHVWRVFHHGLAGSFVFSYTDDWFTGGKPITDWAFGITDRQRQEKPAAFAVSRVWSEVPRVHAIVPGASANRGENGSLHAEAGAEGDGPDFLRDLRIRAVAQGSGLGVEGVDGAAAAQPSGAACDAGAMRLREPALPRVSVVVCSYNGAATLAECLSSLLRLDYPDYEVILVDDGSADDTPAIAARFPGVRTIRQENMGLSYARNVGARAATGEVVAYTDSDCVADETWLLYLVGAMLDQKVDAIGGPNVAPPSDGWVAKCVAASPGGPSHVMLDDRHAEHVPGCNMAFRRDTLLGLGGFDPQFRVAGDDVDICWRFLDAGLEIGYAPSALVWHHHRTSVTAYCRQQKGYGRSEAMLHFKHPRRFNALGSSRWNGIIYGNRAGIPLATPAVYHGRFGSGLFQIVYRRNDVSPWLYCTLLEWHALALVLLSVSVVFPSLGILALLLWACSLTAAVRLAARAAFPPSAPWWCRPLVCGLHLVQPAVRAWYRYAYRFRHSRVRDAGAGVPSEAAGHVGPSGSGSALLSSVGAAAAEPAVKKISSHEFDIYWQSEANLGREHLLDTLVEIADRAGWPGDFHAEWETFDVELTGTGWHDIRLRTATEELGYPRRFTRVRVTLRRTVPAVAACAVLGVWTLAAVFWAFDHHVSSANVATHATAAVVRQGLLALGPLAACGVLWLWLAGALSASRRRCRQAVARLVGRAAAAVGLESVGPGGAAGARPAGAVMGPSKAIPDPGEAAPLSDAIVA